MGRVSRIMKAAKDKPGDLRAGADAELSRLLACWGAMPAHYKQTIMSLVEIVEGKQRSAEGAAPEPPS